MTAADTLSTVRVFMGFEVKGPCFESRMLSRMAGVRPA